MDSGKPKAQTERKLTVREIFATLRKKELYGNMAMHVFVLIPITVFLGSLGWRLDANWGLSPTFGPPWNIVIALACFALGGYVVWSSYGYLYLKGEGSPGSHMGHTRKLVDTGIYSWVRHPSVIGKAIGVVGLGILMRSPAFLFFIFPILLVYSYVTNICIQEKYCRENFGEEYDRYRREVPMFVPRISRLRQYWQERKEQ